jgi:hypothetical protein
VDLGPFTPCRQTAGVTASGQTNFPLGPLVRADRHVLHAQLQNAIKQVVESPTTTSTDCLVCTLVIAPLAPTQPDFQVSNVSGDKQVAQGFTSVYSIAVNNEGTRPPSQVQVAIQVSGAVAYVAMAQTPAGWDCSGTAPILCVGPLGGSGDPIQSLVAAFGVQVRGAKTGIGSISASADPNGLIAESDESNNAKTLAITVK